MGRMQVNDKLKGAFFSYVNKNDPSCWNWRGYVDNTGYGRLGFNYRYFLAHRLSWMIHNGVIPNGLMICHRCNNRKCVRPSHLYLGTHKDNHNDSVIAGTWTRGTHQRNTHLTASDVLRIRKLAAGGTKQRTLAHDYGVLPSAINNIVKRRNWAWL